MGEKSTIQQEKTTISGIRSNMCINTIDLPANYVTISDRRTMYVHRESYRSKQNRYDKFKCFILNQANLICSQHATFMFWPWSRLPEAVPVNRKIMSNITAIYRNWVIDTGYPAHVSIMLCLREQFTCILTDAFYKLVAIEA